MTAACADCGEQNDSSAASCARCGAPMGNPAARALIGSTILGAYQLVDAIGKGGMSVVYKARHRVTEQVVALKILPAELAIHDDIKARFVEEAKALAKLEHPNIVRLYNFGEEKGRFVLAMQYVEGTTFERKIFASGRLDWREAAYIGVQVLAALDFAHRRGVVHRDIKPSNILVRPDGTATVMDFGIAKMSEGSSRLTATGQTMGTVRYMSPEQVRGKTLDHRSDLYSVGATLFEAIVGETPFDGATHFDIMMKHLNEPAPTLRARLGATEVPVALERAIGKSLSKELRGRYQSAAQFRADLEEVLTAAGVMLPAIAGESQGSGRPVTEHEHEPDTATSTYVPLGDAAVSGIAGMLEPEHAPPPTRRPRRRWLLAAGLGGALVASSIAFLFITGKPDGAGQRDAAPDRAAAWPDAFVVPGLTPVLDRRFDDPEGVRVLAARPLDAAHVAAAALAARRRFAAYVREKAGGIELSVSPLNLVVAPAAIICAPALHPSGPPADCAVRPPHFVYPPRRATLYVLDDERLETLNLVEGISAHLCISTEALLERGCMRSFLPPYWDEVARAL